MSKQYRVFSFILIAFVIGVSFLSCVMRPHRREVIEQRLSKDDVTDSQRAEIDSMNFYVLRPGEEATTIYIGRTDSPLEDLSAHEGGIWYTAYHDKIVSIEAYKEFTRFKVYEEMRGFFFMDSIKAAGYTHKTEELWRVDYVDGSSGNIVRNYTYLEKIPEFAQRRRRHGGGGRKK